MSPRPDTYAERDMDRVPDAPATKLEALHAKRREIVDLDDGELTISEQRWRARRLAELDQQIAAEEAAEGKV